MYHDPTFCKDTRSLHTKPYTRTGAKQSTQRISVQHHIRQKCAHAHPSHTKIWQCVTMLHANNIFKIYLSDTTIYQIRHNNVPTQLILHGTPYDDARFPCFFVNRFKYFSFTRLANTHSFSFIHHLTPIFFQCIFRLFLVTFFHHALLSYWRIPFVTPPITFRLICLRGCRVLFTLFKTVHIAWYWNGNVLARF